MLINNRLSPYKVFRKAFFVFLTLLWSLSASAQVYQQVEDVPNTRLESNAIHVSDPDNLISAEYENKINAVLGEIRSQADVFVVALSSIGNRAIEAFATELFNYWGIGDAESNNGLLILWVTDQRKVKFETGYGLETTLPDALCYKIASQIIVPYFKEEKYSEGLYAGVCSVAGVFGYLPDDSEVSSNQIAALKQNNQPKKTERKNQGKNSGSFNNEPDEKSQRFLHWLLIGVVAFLLWSGVSDLKLFRKEKKEAIKKMMDYRAPSKKVDEVLRDFWSRGHLLSLSAIRRMRKEYLKKQSVCICPRGRKTKQRMRLLSNAEAAEYLDEDQLFEEKLGVKKAYVLQCDFCKNVKTIELTTNKGYRYYRCPECSCLTCKVKKTSVITKATTSYEGEGLYHIECLRCGHTFTDPFVIPRKSDSSSGGSSSDSGGGGGSFGGGHSGGGGATVSY